MRSPEPHFVVVEPTFVARFLLDPETDVAATVADIDLFVDLSDGLPGSLTSLPSRRFSGFARSGVTGELADGSHFWASDQVILPEPGVNAMTAAIRKLVCNGDIVSAGDRSGE